jgi:glycosyltransferase involved in cell wall biosynthesis
MKNLSIVIPVFNEEERIHTTFKALKKLSLPRGLKLSEVIFINDGSTDKTVKRLQSFKKTSKLNIQILDYKINNGKGFAVKKGMLYSSSDYTLLCDADMSTPFSELKKFMPHVKNNEDIVIGTRKNGKSTVVVHQPKIRETLGKGFTAITKIALNINVTDFTCGFKLFSKRAIEKLFSKSVINRWGYDAEILFLAKKNNIKVVECPVLWSNDKRSHVNLAYDIPKTMLDLFFIRATHGSFSEITEKSQIVAFKTLRFYKVFSLNK